MVGWQGLQSPVATCEKHDRTAITTSDHVAGETEATSILSFDVK